MNKLAFYLCFFVIQVANAQDFYFEPYLNANNSGLPGATSYIKHLQAVNDSTIIVAGEFNGVLSMGNETIATTNSDDVFIGNLTNEGQVRWLKKIGSDDAGGFPFNDEINDLQIDHEGNIIACGYVGANGQFDTQPQSPYRGAFITKISINGTVLWHQVMENYFSTTVGDNKYRATTIAVTPQNEYVLGGTMLDSMQSENHTFYIDPAMNENPINLGVYYMAVSDTGNLLWFKSAKGGDNSATTLNQTAIKLVCYDEAIYAYGMYQSLSSALPPIITFDDTTLEEPGIKNLYITKFDLQGNLVWAKSSEFGYSIGSRDLILFDDRIIISGETTGPLFFDNSGLEEVQGLFDLFIGVFDLDGHTLSFDRYGGENTERLNHFSVIEGKLFGFGHYDTSTDINGITFHASTLPSPGGFMFNPFYLEFDNDMVPVGGRHINLEEEEFMFQNRYNRFTSVATTNNEVYIGGIYKGNLQVDDVDYTSTGHIGAFTIQSALTGISASADVFPSQRVNLFPNPANEEVRIEFTDTDLPVFISLYDLHGALLSTIKCNAVETLFSLADYPPGVYAVKGMLQNGQIVFADKIVVY